MVHCTMQEADRQGKDKISLYGFLTKSRNMHSLQRKVIMR